MATLDKVFKAAINFNASDIHIVPGEPFIIRRLARMVKMKSDKLSAGANPANHIRNSYR